MDIETDMNLHITSKPCTLPLKHQEWVRKEMEGLGKAWIIQRGLSLYTLTMVIVPRKCLPGSLVHETKRLCIDYGMMNTQLPTVFGNKSLGQ